MCVLVSRVCLKSAPHQCELGPPCGTGALVKMCHLGCCHLPTLGVVEREPVKGPAKKERTAQRFSRTAQLFGDGSKREGEVAVPAKALEEARARDPGFMPRLSWKHGPRAATDWSQIIPALAAERELAVFCDNSAFDDTVPAELWDVLLEEPGRLVITPRVWSELRTWLAKRSNHPVRRAIAQKNPGLRIQNEPESGSPGRRAFDYYVDLLARRRRGLEIARSIFREDHGREPTPDDEQELKTSVQKNLGQRGLLLATKAPGLLTDEVLVYLAARHAITTGTLTIVLTRDADIEEQFFKLLWLIETHYRGMLLADQYVDGRLVTTRPIPDEILADPTWPFEEAVLLERDSQMRGLLPRECHPVGLSCFCAGVYFSQLNFMAETEMSRLLRIKDETGGLSTDRLGGRNMHASTNPIPLGGGRDCAALVLDKRVPAGSDGATVARLDIMQAISPVEVFSTLVPR